MRNRYGDTVEEKKVLIIGAGGIGSYLCAELHRLIVKGQISPESYSFEVADNDSVELKNIQYQNFENKDILKNKAEIMADRYSFYPIKARITGAKQLEGYNLIILAVDNSLTRKAVYDYCFANGIQFIDLRATGRGCGAFTDKYGQKIYETIDGNSNENSSCQNKFELEAGLIQNGNKIIASIGSQYFLNYIRGDTSPANFVARF
jgi:molybdopterin/thiamine biosynthesis adenylyltransferase